MNKRGHLSMQESAVTDLEKMKIEEQFQSTYTQVLSHDTIIVLIRILRMVAYRGGSAITKAARIRRPLTRYHYSATNGSRAI